MNDRRDFLMAASGLAAAVIPARAQSANNRMRAGFIGMGRMGMSNLGFALRMENLEVAAVCDVYAPHLQKAVDATKGQAKGIKDFREILADKSIDIVCIATPDHWHPYMMVEACKAGKDVYVEKPISVTVEEGQQMVKAARKYNRVVQCGTQQRSQVHFQKVAEIVQSGKLGEVTFVRTWNYANGPKAGIGNPPDAEPPKDLDWDMWLGPAPKRPFNANRFGVDPKNFSHFRWFWDYAGGMMTDWGVHLLDIVQMANKEVQPRSVVSIGTRNYIRDNRDTPDTLVVTYEYPGFIATYENRLFNNQSMFNQGYGILFHGAEATLFCDRSGYRIISEKPGGATEEAKSSNNGNREHWINFLDCVRTRQHPRSDIEICHKSTSTCHLGNVALRSRLRLDWDSSRETVAQAEARKYLSRETRKPWRITV